MNEREKRDELINLMVAIARLIKKEKTDGILREETNDKIDELYIALKKMHGD